MNDNKKLIKALKIADAIQKSVKDQLGRYVYYENHKFSAETNECRIEIETEWELPKGYYSTKELIAVLSTPFHRPESDVDFIAYERDDDKWKLTSTSKEITDTPDHLFQSVLDVGTAYNKKEKDSDLVSNLFFSENTVLCTNKHYILESWSIMDKGMLFYIKGGAIDILKKCNNPTSISLCEGYVQFIFDNYTIMFRTHDADDKITKLQSICYSKEGYPNKLSEDQIKAIKSKSAVLKSKNEIAINIDDYLNLENACYFIIDLLLKIIDFAENFYYDAESKKLFFAKNNIRGVLIGYKS